jgi:hypothetical protein
MIDHRNGDHPWACKCGEAFASEEARNEHQKEEDDILQEEMATLIEEELERVGEHNDNGNRQQIGMHEMCDDLAGLIMKRYYVFREDL